VNETANVQPMNEDGQARTRLGRMLWNAAGTLFLVLGVIGIPVPLLPTTPLLLLAASCYLRGSARMHKWLLTNKYFGAYLNDYRMGKGMPLRVKAATLALLWIFIGVAMLFAVSDTIVRGLLLLVAIGVTIHILMLKTKKRSE